MIDVDVLFDALESSRMSEPEAEFLEIFRDEANERLDTIVDTLLALEGGSAAADAIDASSATRTRSRAAQACSG